MSSLVKSLSRSLNVSYCGLSLSVPDCELHAGNNLVFSVFPNTQPGPRKTKVNENWFVLSWGFSKGTQPRNI